MRITRLSTIAVGAALILAACAPSKITSKSVKEKLEKAGYKVTITEKEKVQTFAKFEGFEDKLTGLLASATAAPEYIDAYFFDSADTANKAWEAVATDIVGVKYGEVELKGGVHNNVIYTATDGAIKTAGLTL